MLTQERLKEVLHYNPDTGAFTWIKRTSNYSRIQIGDTLKCLNSDGYITTFIDRSPYKAHRLAFLYMAGRWPSRIDHVNGVRNDNKWLNLRECTVGQNNQNQRRPQKGNPYLGVHWHKYHKKWAAQITVKKTRSFLGYYGTPEEARDVYINAKRGLHEFGQL